MADDHGARKRKEVIEKMSLLQTVLQTAPSYPMRSGGYGGGSFIFGAISAISTLVVAIGIFYVLMKLGSFLDAMKEKTEAGSAKK